MRENNKTKLMAFMLLLLALLTGACTKGSDSALRSGELGGNYYLVSAYFKGEPVPGATVIAVTADSSAIIKQCNSRGQIIVKTNQPLIQVCCVTLYRYGTMEIDSSDEVKVDMETITNNQKTSTKPISIQPVAECYFATGDTIAAFQYKGDFYEYKSYASFMPNLAVSTDPNHWRDKSVDDWLPVWEGKELFIPKRYREFYKAAYGKSLIKSLCLISVFNNR